MSFADWIPEPSLVLFGCQPWTAVPAKPGQCPVCGSGIREGHDSAHCAKCDSSSPRIERRIRAVRAGMRARDRAEEKAKAARDELRKKRVELSESERRRLWNGYKGGVLSPTSEVTNRSKVGRDWLTSIGQAPDWSLILDARGNVIGRIEAEAEVA